jgi:4-amino-4-deoxy-L-arabinose transferase-like glycosyltransferase
MSSRHSELWRPAPLALAGVLALCAGLRVAWALATDVDPRRDFHFDMTWYDLAALRVTEGALLRDAAGTPTAFWPPGYPLLLGAVYAVFGPSLWVAKGLNVALATATCAMTFALGARLFGAGVGLAAAAAYAALPGDVFYAPLLLSEVPFTALVAAVLLLFAVAVRRDRAPVWLGLGLLLGAAALTRGAGSLLAAVPLAAVWLGGGSLGRTARAALLIALGLLAVVLPWTLRNARVMGAPVAISTSVGMSFYYAHNELADGSETLAMVRRRDELVAPLRELAQPRREVAEMRLGLAEALRFARENPLRELSLVPRRWRHLYAHDHAGLRWASPARAGAERAPVLGPVWDRRLATAADAAFFGLGLLALLGVPAALAGRDPARLALPLCVAYLSLLHGFLFVGDARYHAPLAPVLALLGACGARSLARWLLLLPHSR